jgi:integrase
MSSIISRKKKGASQELTKINKWLRSPIANRPLKDLDSADFAAWRDERLAEGVAPATIRNYLAIVSHLYNVARREWRIKLDNPIADVAKPRVNNARDRRLSQEEQSYLLDALENPGSGAGNRKNKYVLPIYLFALETAMRQSEILGLEWQHIDLKKNTARLYDTKNGEDSSVPLSSKAAEILQSLQGMDIRKVRGPVFPTTASALKQSFARARERAKRNYKADCEKAGREPNKGFLADFVYHDTRHEATSLFFERGDLDMMEVASITRHKDMRMLKRYTHLRAEKLAKKLG